MIDPRQSTTVPNTSNASVLTPSRLPFPISEFTAVIASRRNAAALNFPVDLLTATSKFEFEKVASKFRRRNQFHFAESLTTSCLFTSVALRLLAFQFCWVPLR